MTKVAKPALPFVKVYVQRMASSSIWEEPLCVRWMFVYLLGIADNEGVVLRTTVTNLARLANMTLDEAVLALERLEAPDPHSRTPDEDGRRIVPLEGGGWRVVNALAYREMQTPKQAYDAARMRKLRERKKRAPKRKTAGELEVDRYDAVTGKRDFG